MATSPEFFFEDRLQSKSTNGLENIKLDDVLIASPISTRTFKLEDEESIKEELALFENNNDKIQNENTSIDQQQPTLSPLHSIPHHLLAQQFNISSPTTIMNSSPAKPVISLEKTVAQLESMQKKLQSLKEQHVIPMNGLDSTTTTTTSLPPPQPNFDSADAQILSEKMINSNVDEHKQVFTLEPNEKTQQQQVQTQEKEITNKTVKNTNNVSTTTTTKPVGTSNLVKGSIRSNVSSTSSSQFKKPIMPTKVLPKTTTTTSTSTTSTSTVKPLSSKPIVTKPTTTTAATTTTVKSVVSKPTTTTATTIKSRSSTTTTTTKAIVSKPIVTKPKSSTITNTTIKQEPILSPEQKMQQTTSTITNSPQTETTQTSPSAQQTTTTTQPKLSKPSTTTNVVRKTTLTSTSATLDAKKRTQMFQSISVPEIDFEKKVEEALKAGSTGGIGKSGMKTPIKHLQVRKPRSSWSPAPKVLRTLEEEISMCTKKVFPTSSMENVPQNNASQI